MEDHLTQNGTQTHQKWKTISPKRKDDLIQNGRRPQLKQNTTKNENDPEGRLPESKTTKRKMTNKEDDQKGRQQKKEDDEELYSYDLYGEGAEKRSDTGVNRLLPQYRVLLLKSAVFGYTYNKFIQRLNSLEPH